ncbi:hypothetical protein QQG55_31415 [Brugia pahangi]|uniref:Ovule protein n=1 Tax=Brugia pahangi TaxID=6280 RepID=A0A0N4SZU1_BRUPA|nr:unnamed protein product [Brugia pahangi]
MERLYLKVKGRTRKIRHVEYSRHPTPQYNMTCLTNLSNYTQKRKQMLYSDPQLRVAAMTEMTKNEL